MAEGIEIRVAADKTQSYRASVWSNREGKRLRKTFSTMAAGRAWRQEATVAVNSGKLKASKAPTVAEAVTRWLEGAEAGTIRTRARKQFKPSTILQVRYHYRNHIADRWGTKRLDRVDLLDLQEWVDALDAAGTNPSTIEGFVLPLRLAYRWARGRGLVAVDPTDGLELPEKIRGTRLPPAPADAAGLLTAVPEEHRALWATAMLAGLRRGELLALRWEDIDLKAGTLRVERSWDPGAREFVTPKSARGKRRVPIGAALAPLLRAHMLSTGRRAGLAFGRSEDQPEHPGTVQSRTDARGTCPGASTRRPRCPGTGARRGRT